MTCEVVQFKLHLKCTHSKYNNVGFFVLIDKIRHRHEMIIKVCCIKGARHNHIGGLIKSNFFAARYKNLFVLYGF